MKINQTSWHFRYLQAIGATPRASRSLCGYGVKLATALTIAPVIYGVVLVAAVPVVLVSATTSWMFRAAGLCASKAKLCQPLDWS